jgi:hypothetical protein
VSDNEPLPSYVYALGRIEPRFPSLSVEKEFAQATGRVSMTSGTDREAQHAVLSDRVNRYLARQLCWVFAIGGMESYVLAPRDPADLDLLVEALQPRSGSGELDLVIGAIGPIVPPDACGGLTVPVVVFDQVYSFGRAACRPPSPTRARPPAAGPSAPPPSRRSWQIPSACATGSACRSWAVSAPHPCPASPAR